MRPSCGAIFLSHCYPVLPSKPLPANPVLANKVDKLVNGLSDSRVQFSDLSANFVNLPRTHIVSKCLSASNTKISPSQRRIDTCLAIELGGMGSAVTIIFAREDLSIPGAPESVVISADHPNVVQTHFFNLVSDSNPDVIVLDFSRAPPSGTDTILTIRQRSAVPILVACDPRHPMTEDYRIAGAADCIAVPIDIFALNQTILRILRATERVMPLESKPDEEPSVDRTDSRGQHGALASAVSSW